MEMAISCPLWLVSGASLTVQDRNLIAWMIILSAETVG